MPTKRKTELVLAKGSYQRLLGDLRALLEEGRARAEAAVGRELVRTYYALGERILAEKLTERAGYGSAIISDLADELGIAAQVLRNAVLFARVYPVVPERASSLRWAHFRELLRVKDAKTRDWYEEQAAREGWSYRKLGQAIRGRAHERAAARRSKASLAQRQAALRRPLEATYVYKAQVERVVDGDTLLLVVDLGFDVLRRQRVRLAGLDTPPLREARGKKAGDVVRDRLASVPFVVIKTDKVDLYGRYVAHVFYAAGIEDAQQVFIEGRYLNQELIDQGLAVPL